MFKEEKEIGMPHDKDRIGQRAGFIEKAGEHRQRHQDAAQEARAEGRERAASYHDGRAATYSRQIDKTAKNINRLIKDR